MTSSVLPWMLGLVAAAVAGGTRPDPWTEGARVVVEGRVSREPWQHIIRADRAADAVYFDVTDGGQIVAYVRGGLPEGVLLRLEGTVEDARAGAKRPGSKVEVGELQLVVHAWQPVESAPPPAPARPAEPPPLEDAPSPPEPPAPPPPGAPPAGTP